MHIYIKCTLYCNIVTLVSQPLVLTFAGNTRNTSWMQFMFDCSRVLIPPPPTPASGSHQLPTIPETPVHTPSRQPTPEDQTESTIMDFLERIRQSMDYSKSLCCQNHQQRFQEVVITPVRYIQLYIDYSLKFPQLYKLSLLTVTTTSISSCQ